MTTQGPVTQVNGGSLDIDGPADISGVLSLPQVADVRQVILALERFVGGER